MKREIRLFVEDILTSISDIEEFTKGLDKERFFNDKLRQSAVIRHLEIIGEAAKNIPDSFRKKHPDVPWGRVAGTRDKMIHAYSKVDLDIVWEIIKRNLPKLKKQIEEIELDAQKT